MLSMFRQHLQFVKHSSLCPIDSAGRSLSIEDWESKLDCNVVSCLVLQPLITLDETTVSSTATACAYSILFSPHLDLQEPQSPNARAEVSSFVEFPVEPAPECCLALRCPRL